MSEAQVLFIGRRDTGIVIRPDPEWPAMFRVHWPDGKVSGMANEWRCRDAARTWGKARFNAGGEVTFQWRRIIEPALAGRPARADAFRCRVPHLALDPSDASSGPARPQDGHVNPEA